MVCSRQDEAKRAKCTMNVYLTCPQEQRHVYVAKCFERLSRSCPVTCSARLQCGHRCTGNCGSCAVSGTHKLCSAACKEVLPCQHQCQVCAERILLSLLLRVHTHNIFYLARLLAINFTDDDDDDDDESMQLVFAHSCSSKTVTSVLIKICSGKQFSL